MVGATVVAVPALGNSWATRDPATSIAAINKITYLVRISFSLFCDF
jgi:hypothetical protein